MRLRKSIRLAPISPFYSIGNERRGLQSPTKSGEKVRDQGLKASEHWGSLPKERQRRNFNNVLAGSNKPDTESPAELEVSRLQDIVLYQSATLNYLESPVSSVSPVRVLAFLEATSVTGPARNLLEFCQLAPGIPPPWGPVEVVLATFRRPDQSQERDAFLDAAAAHNVRLEVIHERNALDFGTFGRMRDLMQWIQPDILQTHNVKSNFLVYLAGLAKEYPWIAWHHGYTCPTRKQELYNRFDRISLRRARRVVTVTSAFLPELRAAGVPDNKVKIIRNAIQPDWLEQGPPSPAPEWSIPLREAGARIILSIGRLSKEKAHADLIEAIALLQGQTRAENIHLVIVGEGHERENLVVLARRFGVEMTLPGQVKNVRPYFALGDVFVLPSHSEGSPNVLIEAMAAGIPILSTAVGGVGDILDNEKEALLVPPANPQALAAALGRMLENQAMAAGLAVAARARASSELQPEPKSASNRAFIPASAGRMSCSVIVPVYNKALTVRRSLESIRTQTFEKFEVLIINDGSTDQSAEEVRGYLSEIKDSRFRLIEQANSGPGAARNRGISEASNPYLAFLDADDEWLPHYLERSHAALEQAGSEVAAVVMGWFDEPGHSSCFSYISFPAGVVRLTAQTPPQIVASLMVTMWPCTTFVRKEPVVRFGGFKVPHRFAEDVHLWMKIALHLPILILREEAALFHRDASALSGNYKGMRPIEPFLESPEELRDVSPPELRLLLDQFLAIRAMKTACVLAYWGRWREAAALRRKFRVAQGWRLPWFFPSLFAATRLGRVAGRGLRFLKKF